MPRAYFNEFDAGAAAWLRELIAEGHIPPGDVDTRSIADVTADDVRGYTQCHFFAGIGGWAYALRLAGWPDDRPVWTGSCPCQPYSTSGKGLGDADARNLWPVFFRLIRELRPDVVFGEQVEAAIRHGWLDTVSADLEGEGYAVGAAVLGAHSVGAPHIRQRLYWVADAGHGQCGRTGVLAARCETEAYRQQAATELGGRGEPERLAHALASGRPSPRPVGDAGRGPRACDRCGSRRLADADCQRCREAGKCCREELSSGGFAVVRMGEPIRTGLEGLAGHGDDRGQPGLVGEYATRPASATSGVGFWERAEFIPCRDGKARPVEPGIFPLAHGVSGRVALLRGAGNAIVPQVAAEFIQAWCESKAGDE